MVKHEKNNDMELDTSYALIGISLLILIVILALKMVGKI